VSPLVAVMFREGRIRATNLLFIFWDVVYPLGYLLVFGVGINNAVEFTSAPADYNAFFLAGVLGMASFGIASNTAWSFFLDRDNGIYFEMLTYPLSRAQYLVGKVLFNILVAILQAAITIVLAHVFLDVPIRTDPASLLLVLMFVIVGTAAWFFFYAIFAVSMRRNDAFNTVTSVFYFVFLFASSMFYPLEPLPAAFRVVAYANPITWQVDVLRYATVGLGDASAVPLEILGFVLFTIASFAGALVALRKET
jgi:ABC-2 type transport system permease protein